MIDVKREGSIIIQSLLHGPAAAEAQITLASKEEIFRILFEDSIESR